MIHFVDQLIYYWLLVEENIHKKMHIELNTVQLVYEVNISETLEVLVTMFLNSYSYSVMQRPCVLSACIPRKYIEVLLLWYCKFKN